MEKRFALGIDYGTASVRALLLDFLEGVEVASSVFYYPHGVEGVLEDESNPLVARQHPEDYIHGFYQSVQDVLNQGKRSGCDPAAVIGLGVDATGSTPIPVDSQGTPLAMTDRYANNLNAMAWLWKDHSSFAEAGEITDRIRESKLPYLSKCGGSYSSEWFWSKILHCLRTDPETGAAAATWVELSDFIPAFITGRTRPEQLVRNACAAGHKAMYNSSWGGLPAREFLTTLDPRMAILSDSFSKPQTASEIAGLLSPEAAFRSRLPQGIPVATGAIDAHLGAVGAGIAPGALVKIIGTSTCDMMVHPLNDPLPDIPGLCGAAEESILPGMLGLEAGQSAVGDLFNWFVRQFGEGNDPELVHRRYTDQASELLPGETGLLALDWNNGNRTILIDPLLSGLLLGTTLQTRPCEIYRALIEATAFGALRIIEQLEHYGVPVNQVIACGGIAAKNPLLMQIYADVCNRPMIVSRSTQSCALGAAIYGAFVGGAFSTLDEAREKLVPKPNQIYKPNAEHVATYKRVGSLWRQLHDAFGIPGTTSDLSYMMKELIALRDAQRVRNSTL